MILLLVLTTSVYKKKKIHYFIKTSKIYLDTLSRLRKHVAVSIIFNIFTSFSFIPLLTLLWFIYSFISSLTYLSQWGMGGGRLKQQNLFTLIHSHHTNQPSSSVHPYPPCHTLSTSRAVSDGYGTGKESSYN